LYLKEGPRSLSSNINLGLKMFAPARVTKMMKTVSQYCLHSMALKMMQRTALSLKNPLSNP